MQREKVDYLPLAKQIAIVAQSSIHPAFDFLLCLGPLILGGTIWLTRVGQHKLLQVSNMQSMNPGLFSLWTSNEVLLWHAFHNLVDWRDLNDDDKVNHGFYCNYGCHALKEGSLSRSQYLRLMGLVALPGALVTVLLGNPVMGHWTLDRLDPRYCRSCFCMSFSF